MLYMVITLTGILNAMQAGCNATLQRSLGQPVLSALISFATGTAALLLASVIYSAAFKAPIPSGPSWSSVPWWGWVGGLFGAFFILVMVLTAERVGSGIFVGLTVTGSILTSLAMDHFGLLGFKQHTASPGRLLGGALMVGGMLLIAKF